MSVGGARGDIVVRVIQVIRLLCTHEMSIGGLAANMACTERTVYRTLHAIDRAGLPLISVRTGQHVRYHLVRADTRDLLLGSGRESHRARQRRRVQEHARAGLCSICSHPAAPGLRRCPRHAQRHADAERERAHLGATKKIT